MPGTGTVAPEQTEQSPPGEEPTGISFAVFDALYISSPQWWLGGILAAYLIVAALFAYNTPKWQAPDEPAHYNYIAHIAQGRGLPVLNKGDYNENYLQWLKDARFPSRSSIASLRYEHYQPPLYYLLATPVYWLSDGSLFALRLFSVFLGAITIVLLYHGLILVFPVKTLIPLGATAFAAALPMHVAVTASVNNDILAELLIMATLLVLLRWMRAQYYATNTSSTRQFALLGILLGLGLLTKIYAYLLLPIVLLVVILINWLQPRICNASTDRHPGNESPNEPTLTLTKSPAGLQAALRAALLHSWWVLVPAILLAFPFWLRNILLYGRWDVLGLARHDAVVVGQARTGDWIAYNGWVAYGERAFGFTFQSFWGVFGWLGVFMDDRIYTALLLFTGVLFLGLLWATVRFISGGPDADMDPFQISVLLLFGVILLAVTASFLWYNIKYVQHQGRYFFWGILPISAFVALGWREVLQPVQGAITAFLATVLAGATFLTGSLSGHINKWTVLSITLIAIVLWLQPLLLMGTDRLALRRLPTRAKRWIARPIVRRTISGARSLVWALPFILLFLLDIMIPNLYLLPQLAK